MADKQTKVNMISSQSWRDHFKVDQSVLEAFWEEFSQNSPLRASEMNPSDAGSSIEFVLWCIQQGHFTEEAFVQWQSEAFEIPVVRQAYFEAPIDTMFWDRVKEIHPWNATCVPLAEWDDVLLVAVVNPSAQELSLSKRHRVVLAAPSRLRDYFERVDQATASKPVIAAAPAATPEEKPKFEMPATPKAAASLDDSGDPFAALSRELGLLNNQDAETSDGHASTEAASDSSANEAPEGLVLPDGLIMPEGLNFGDLGKAAADEAAGLVASAQAEAGDDTPADDSVNFDLNGAAGAPEGFTIPSPSAKANQDETDTNAAADGGTLVHNFETGTDEVVAKAKLNDDSLLQPKPASPPPLNLNVEPDPVAAAADAPVAITTHAATAPVATTPADAAAVNAAASTTPPDVAAALDSDDPLAALVMAASGAMNEVQPEAPASDVAPAKTGKNSGIPDLPFSIPRHDPEDSAKESTRDSAKTPSAPKPLAMETKTPEPPTTEPVAPVSPAAAPKTGRIRKPLFAPVDDAATQAISQPTKPPAPTTPPKTGTGSAFEPRSSKGAGFEATQAVSIQNNTPQHDAGQDTQVGGKTGTFAGTQTRSRRLENTPVTSMLGTGQAGVHQERPEAPGGNPTYLNKSIAIGKLDPIHLDQCRSIDEAGAQAILQACNIYECAMILLFRGGDLVPWKWNDLFLSVRGDKPEPIDLVEPSIFKVVFRTAKPYHGYIVTSEVNQKFFNEFYRGMLPKHATITPLMIDGRMGGMVLGFTNSKVDYRQSLRLMERLTFDLARVFKSLRGTMAKAG